MRLDYHNIVPVFDLDDTLYPERDYALSGYRAIEMSIADRRGHEPDGSIASLMLNALDTGSNPMDALMQSGLAGDMTLDEAISIYRQHTPVLTLPTDSLNTLSELTSRGICCGIITEGDTSRQMAKIRALGLDRYIAPDCICISQKYGCTKEQPTMFAHFVHQFPEARAFAYIGDNPAKDFSTPAAMGWATICLADKGHNIHPQTPSEGKPWHPACITVSTLAEAAALLTNTDSKLWR